MQAEPTPQPQNQPAATSPFCCSTEPSTASWAQTAATTLTNSKALLIPGAGHDVIQWNDCAIEVTLNFLNNPTDNYDTTCLDQLTVPPFA
jgi:hypothetical protein